MLLKKIKNSTVKNFTCYFGGLVFVEVIKLLHWPLIGEFGPEEHDWVCVEDGLEPKPKKSAKENANTLLIIPIDPSTIINDAIIAAMDKRALFIFIIYK